MKKTENNKNVFDEIDRDQFKTAIKISRTKRILEIQTKILKGLIILVFMFSAVFICLGIFDELNIADISMGIIGLISAVCGLVFLKIISKI